MREREPDRRTPARRAGARRRRALRARCAARSVACRRPPLASRRSRTTRPTTSSAGSGSSSATIPPAAVGSLRRALFIESDFGLAAFKLGSAHEALGDPAAARRAYERALRTLDPHERHEPFLGQIDLADIATAARARLDVLAVGAAPVRP